jgi:predicted DNA-binding transcriptional regulator AlpA
VSRGADILALLARIADRLDADSSEGLRADDAAKFCGVSRSSWYDLDARGLCPMPAEIGCTKVWPKSELRAWLLSGSPSRNHWNGLRYGAMRRSA